MDEVRTVRPEGTSSASDSNRLIAAFAHDRVGIDLKTVHLCFLAGLYLRAKKDSLASFEEEALLDMFEQVCELVEPGAENPRKRATHAIQHLREQRMFARVDGTGVIRAGEYALTRLAAAVIECFLADEALTRESLTLLTAVLRAQLAEILAAAKKAGTPDAWRSQVTGPLRVTVADLISGIERRQRGLDTQQEEVQAEIAQLLHVDWFGAIDRCQALLEATTDTLRELNEVLLRDTHHFVALLQDVQSLAATTGAAEVEEAVQRVIEHVDRIGAWGAARLRVWSDYYQYVHRYLRDVVRLDPDRALSQRLRDQVARWPAHPFFLQIARAPSIRLLRPLELRTERPPVIRPRMERDTVPAEVTSSDVLELIERLVRSAVVGGAATLADITAQVLPELPQELRYAATGHIATVIARGNRVSAGRERAWKSVLDRLEIEDWDIVLDQEQS